MLFRLSLFDIITLHFLIGVGFGIFYVIHCQNRSKPRKLFRFGGRDAFSVGPLRDWLRWWGCAYVFEILTSFLLGEHLYQELAMSAFEAAGLTLGLFVVDRVILFFENVPDVPPRGGEEAPPPPDIGKKIRGIFSSNRQAGADRAAAETQAERDARAERQRRYDRAVKGR